MKRPQEMSPMKAMMGIKKSSTPSARTIRRASKVFNRASSTVMAAPRVPRMMKRQITSLPQITKRKFGEGGLGAPKLRLDDDKMKMPDMKTAHTTPSISAKAAKAPNAPAAGAVAGAAAGAVPTKKPSTRVLRRAAKASK